MNPGTPESLPVLRGLQRVLLEESEGVSGGDGLRWDPWEAR